ncbi:MAG: HypC/HybG/HupF family hydrogenase formation chaperone [Deltaproteobacteria bacterium]|nr:HypC/HybG/HupF family hydrogenase formation chaperone [Deltaproteobacteria bacterium]
MCLGVPGQIVETKGEEALFRGARVSFGGILKDVSLACVPEASVGDWVLVHAGLALTVLDEQDARQQLDDLRRMIELEDELSDELSDELGEGEQERGA